MSGVSEPFVRRFYPCVFRIDDVNRFVLWHSHEASDDELVCRDGRVLSRTDLAGIREFAAADGIAVEPDEAPVYDWDETARWCAAPFEVPMTANDALHALNMLDDALRYAPAAASFRASSGAADDVHDLLFDEWDRHSREPQPPSLSTEVSFDEVTKIAGLIGQGIVELRREFGEG